MKMSIVRKQPTLLVLLGVVALTTFAALTQTAFAYQDRAKQAFVTLKDNKPTQTAFTYQGQLKEGSVPANGTYTFRFALYPSQSGGRNLGVVIKDNVVVNKGSFTVQLDFGSEGSSSDESWLEVGARRANTADSYMELSPRQRLTPVPSAIAAQAEPRSVIGVPLAPQDLGAWIKDGRTVRLATSTDNVGIGTTKPVATLDVAGTIHASEAVTVGNSVGLLSSGSLNLIEVDNSNPLAIGFSNPFTTTPNPVAFSTIRVGIGTTSPTNTLDVNGQARIRALPPNTLLNDVVVAAPNGLLFTRPASTLGGAGSWLLAGNALATGNEVLGTTNNYPLKFITNGLTAEKMRIQTNGNVGIATTAPTQRLTLGSGNVLLPTANFGTDGNLYFGGITDSGQTGMRLFGGVVNTTTPGGFIDVRVNPSNLTDGLRFRVDSSIGGTERMRITAAGNVGIATPNPTNTLDVNGQARVRVLTANPLLNDVVVADSSGVLFTRPASTISGGGSFWSLTGNVLTTGNEFLGTTNNFPLRVFTNNTEKMRVLANGNVGLGTTTPNEQLEITGNFRMPASTASAGVIKSGANRFIHNFGPNNFFAGVNAGNLTLSGYGTTGVGVNALQSLTTGGSNTAVGYVALGNTTTGPNNTAVGNGALLLNVTGNGNTAVGVNALETNTANSNTAFGVSALVFKTTGDNNTALGFNAGVNLTSGSNNIYIGNAGTATESTTIRIGAGQNRAFIAGIRNVTTGVANALPVVIDGNGQLGTVSSSQRFKEHIEKMGAASEVLYRLRPVSFLYKPEYGGKPDLPQFGLIAEDVAKVAPDLVVYDDQGKPYTVNYQFLTPMLLNELQKKDLEIEKLRARLDALEKLVQELMKK